MDGLQFVYPWSHTFYFGIIMLGLGIMFLLGLYLLYRSSKLNNRKWKIVLTVFSILLIALPTKNFLGYKNNEYLTFEKYAGKYQSADKTSELNLLTNNTWTSSGLQFICKTGKWDVIISEDGTYIELFCSKTENKLLQLWPTNDLKIFVSKDNEASENIELQKTQDSQLNKWQLHVWQ
jgi:hypothetical protein